ncbi:MAG: tyrosine-type recombinase/integrase [Bacteroidota bacterium]
MNNNKAKIKILSRKEEQALFYAITSKIKSERKQAMYGALVALMIDCGCRVSEVIQLEIQDVDSVHRCISIRTLKKRGEVEIRRQVDMTQRVLSKLALWWKYLKDIRANAYVFPSDQSEDGHLSRKSVWHMLKKLTDGKVHPHILRHTFGSNVVEHLIETKKNAGAALVTAKELLGHTDIKTTQIYLHARRDSKSAAIQAIDPTPSWKRLWLKFFPTKHLHVLPMQYGQSKFHVGRKEELEKLHDLCQKKVNIYLCGEQGLGKSHLLDNLEAQAKEGIHKILRIDDMTGIKKSLQGLVLFLLQGDKEAVAELLFGRDKELDKIVTKDSIKRCCEILCEITLKHEYTILVDDATRISPNGVSVLEKLREHFHLIVAARKIPMRLSTFLSNFEKIELQNLKRAEAVELISRASQDFTNRIEDWELYKTHIWRSTIGNPLYTLELVDRFRREPVITTQMLTTVRHNQALPEWDMSLPVGIALSSLMVLRYLGGEFGDDSGAFRLIGGAFLVFALFIRRILTIGKRKFI